MILKVCSFNSNLKTLIAHHNILTAKIAKVWVGSFVCEPQALCLSRSDQMKIQVVQSDGFMNITLEEVEMLDPRGSILKFSSFFIPNRLIRQLFILHPKPSYQVAIHYSSLGILSGSYSFFIPKHIIRQLCITHSKPFYK